MLPRDKIALLQQRVAMLDDEQAYEELYGMFYAPLLHLAQAFVKSRQLGEEIVSDVFINIWERRRQLLSVNNLTLYLYTSARNTALNYLKKQKKERFHSLDNAAAVIKDREMNPEQLLITAEMLKKIQEAVRQLPPKCKLIYQLVKEDGLKYREAAGVLNLSLKTVEAQMAIAMKRIYEAVNLTIDGKTANPAQPLSSSRRR